MAAPISRADHPPTNGMNLGDTSSISQPVSTNSLASPPTNVDQMRVVFCEVIKSLPGITVTGGNTTVNFNFAGSATSPMIIPTTTPTTVPSRNDGSETNQEELNILLVEQLKKSEKEKHELKNANFELRDKIVQMELQQKWQAFDRHLEFKRNWKESGYLNGRIQRENRFRRELQAMSLNSIFPLNTPTCRMIMFLPGSTFSEELCQNHIQAPDIPLNLAASYSTLASILYGRFVRGCPPFNLTKLCDRFVEEFRVKLSGHLAGRTSAYVDVAFDSSLMLSTIQALSPKLACRRRGDVPPAGRCTNLLLCCTNNLSNVLICNDDISLLFD